MQAHQLAMTMCCEMEVAYPSAWQAGLILRMHSLGFSGGGSTCLAGSVVVHWKGTAEVDFTFWHPFEHLNILAWLEGASLPS